MIIEHQLSGVGSALVDPDLNAEDFADIAAAAKKVTPSVVISKLREQGGQYWIDILAVINWELGVGLSFPVMSFVHPHSILGVGLSFPVMSFVHPHSIMGVGLPFPVMSFVHL